MTANESISINTAGGLSALSVTADTAAVTASSDTAAIVADTVQPGEAKEGIVLVNPVTEYMKGLEAEDTAPLSRQWGGMSWVYLALAVMFCVISMKFKGNSRYVKALCSDMTDIRPRHNAFDETVRETSLLILMNIMWALNAGVFLWGAVKMFSGSYAGCADGFIAADSFTITCPEWVGIGICSCISALYLIVMVMAYWVVGNVFSDHRKAALWVKGAVASTALGAFFLFPVSLLALIYPEWDMALLWVAAGVFIMMKVMFLYKGFRIFFAEISSWMLFLYYLCSLEIVPLILAYFSAVSVCGAWH